MLKNVLKIIPICCSRNLAVGLKQNVFKPIFMVSSASIIALETSNKPKVLFHKVTSNDHYDILFGIKSWLNDLMWILKIILDCHQSHDPMSIRLLTFVKKRCHTPFF